MKNVIANHDNIDVRKCIGCRKGISLFMEKDGEYIHVDLFATPECGASYKCVNSDVIGKFLVKNGHKGTLLPNKQSQEFFTKQEAWWEDIIMLVYDILKDKKLVSEFFNEGEVDNKVWNLPNIEIENKLLLIALEKGIEVTEDDYPNLIKWDFKKQ